MEAVERFIFKKQNSNTAQWIVTGLERNIVSNLSKYYDLLEPNSSFTRISMVIMLRIVIDAIKDTKLTLYGDVPYLTHFITLTIRLTITRSRKFSLCHFLYKNQCCETKWVARQFL